MRAPRPTVAWPSLRALLWELGLALCALAATLIWWHPASVALAWIFIATRQHALFILYHDGVHGLLARSRRLNDLLIDLTAGIPMLLPVSVYRRFHLSHHATLGSPEDTERLLLYRGQPWDYRPLAALPLAVQILGDLLLVNQLLMGLALLREQRRRPLRLRLPPVRSFPERYALQGLFFGGLALATLADPALTGRAALLWFGPLLTLSMAIQKIRSFAEHAALGAPQLSRSWRPGWLARQLLWPYHIGYHREHHARPDLPWYALPQTAEPGGLPTRALWPLLCNGRLLR